LLALLQQPGCPVLRVVDQVSQAHVYNDDVEVAVPDGHCKVFVKDVLVLPAERKVSIFAGLPYCLCATPAQIFLLLAVMCGARAPIPLHCGVGCHQLLQHKEPVAAD
jgi:hypothetical protein